MSTDRPDIAGLQRAVGQALHAHWKLILVEGVVLLILGAAAIGVPPLATLAVTIIFGWLFLLSGVLGPDHHLHGCGMRRGSGGR